MLMRSVTRILVFCFVSCLAACAQLPPRPDLPMDATIALSDNGPLDRSIAPAEAQHPGQSAFRLVIEGTEAFAIRAHSCPPRRAQPRRADLYLARRSDRPVPRAAADRRRRSRSQGRLLVDDMDARAKNAGFAALAAHPNIDVRLFNPFASRAGVLRLIGEGLTDFGRVNRRMHNKSWIADNRIALVGGRNIGDEYYGASDGVNFVDLDFVMVGPVVRDASASFDNYWNSALVYPIELLDAASVNAAQLEQLRTVLSSNVSAPPRTAATPPSCAKATQCSACCRAIGRCSGRRSIGSLPTIR